MQPTLGQRLFAWRSLTPVPVVVACLAWLWVNRGAPALGSLQLDAALDWVGLALCCLGQALRFYTLGWVPEGTSGQNLTIQASTLNTQGPYARVRNPLYVGNLGLVLGLVCIAGNAVVAVVSLGFFFGEYFFIIRAEEAFLLSRFGPAFEVYLATVPRWWPRWRKASDGVLRAGPFDFARALKKEVNPFSAWAVGAVVLLAFERWARGTLTQPLALGFGSAAGLSLLFLLAIKVWKKGWL
jgi:protein-S-isoprenylcysteine O-methyltransferase Ste14